MINVEIKRNNNETGTSVLRRFTKKVQSSGVLPRVRSIRYNLRVPSYYKNKMRTLNGLKMKTDREKLIKLGKIKEREVGSKRK